MIKMRISPEEVAEAYRSLNARPAPTPDRGEHFVEHETDLCFTLLNSNKEVEHAYMCVGSTLGHVSQGKKIGNDVYNVATEETPYFLWFRRAFHFYDHYENHERNEIEQLGFEDGRKAALEVPALLGLNS